MRRSSIISSGWIACVWLLLASGKANAATIQGRVVDSAGQPVAGAEVRIWQKRSVPGAGVTDQQVKFDDGEVLLTDPEGRFSSPDVLVDGAFACIVAEADGMLAGRSGWIEVGNSAIVAPDILLKRLRAVIGQVWDRQQQPVAGAIVFNHGDGHDRVEVTTGSTGKFFLSGVPEGAVFLFVDKPGYRFTGTRLVAGKSEALFTLVSVDEMPEPMPTLPPLLSAEEETGLARQVLDPWVAQVARSGSELQKNFVLASLAHLDPLEALDRLDSLALESKEYREICQQEFVRMSIEHCGQLSAEKARELIEAGKNEFGMVCQYIAAARHLANSDASRQVEWLDSALRHAYRIDGLLLRTHAFALIADALFFAGQSDRAKAALAEAEASAVSLPDNPSSKNVLGILALATAQSDARRAVERLEKIENARVHQQHDGQLALRLLPDRPDLAEEVWNRAVARNALQDNSRSPPHPFPYLADFCYRLATVDRSRAERVARSLKQPVLRLRGKAAIAQALAETEPLEARKRLEALVREELPRVAEGEPMWSRSSWSPSTTAAWLLPIVEEAAPDLCREVFWRSLALRLPRPPRGDFQNERETTDLELAKMLARYDRDVARTLLESVAVRLVERVSPAATEKNVPQAMAVGVPAAGWARDLVVAAVHVDPQRARGLLDEVLTATATSAIFAPEGAKQAFVWTLARHGAERWKEGDPTCAGFWSPRPDNDLTR